MPDQDHALITVTSVEDRHFPQDLTIAEKCIKLAEYEHYMKELSIDIRVMNCQVLKGCATIEEANQHWDTFTKNPLVEDHGSDKKTIKLCFNLCKFNRNEIIVVLDQDKIWVHACREKKGKVKANEFHQGFPLARPLSADEVKATLYKDGILCVTMPLDKPPRLNRKSDSNSSIPPSTACLKDGICTVQSIQSTTSNESILAARRCDDDVSEDSD